MAVRGGVSEKGPIAYGGIFFIKKPTSLSVRLFPVLHVSHHLKLFFNLAKARSQSEFEYTIFRFCFVRGVGGGVSCKKNQGWFLRVVFKGGF